MKKIALLFATLLLTTMALADGNPSPTCSSGSPCKPVPPPISVTLQ